MRRKPLDPPSVSAPPWSRTTRTRLTTGDFFLGTFQTPMKRSNPTLWERSKKKACSQGGLCKHSARKMQWAVQYYKKHGGKYEGPRSASNSLARWTRQRWRTSSGKKSDGVRRYLPDAAWKHLTPSEVRRTNAAKARGYSQGKQWVRQPRDVAKKVRRMRGTR